MDEIWVLLIIMIAMLVLTGPVALIIAIIALKKAGQVSSQLLRKGASIAESARREQVKPPAPVTMPVVSEKPVAAEPKSPQPVAAVSKTVKGPSGVKYETLARTVADIRQKEKDAKRQKFGSIEQQIGTRWILIAGVIVVIVAVGFFLKYAYDNALVGPLGRVAIATVSGLAALVIGEVTRKRGYGTVAKAVSSMGFAILYAAVFSAYRFYGLIEPVPAFALSILVTAMAMFYAVGLNEVLVAVLSLVGGFLTPIIVSTGENLPIQLFTYVLILGIGAMLCAYYRKWRVVNAVSFVGTFLLYIGWFEKFYLPEMRIAEGVPEQMTIALVWLGVFFVVYLIMPLFHGLVKKIEAQKEDVIGVVINAAVTFYLLWTILYGDYRTALAFSAVGLCLVHLILMNLVVRRCGIDLNLRLSLLVVGLFFLTIAIPLYLKMYAVATAWAIEAVVLFIIGLRYRSILTQIGAFAAMVLSVGWLLYYLPMHRGAFAFVVNPPFGTWVLVGASIIICHVLYRRTSAMDASVCSFVSQIFYAGGMLLLMAAFMMEWVHHCDSNIAKAPDAYYIRGLTVLLTMFMLLLVTEPVCPKGVLCKSVGVAVGIFGSLFVLICHMEVYRDTFTIIANVDLATAALFVAGLFACAWLLSHVAGKVNSVYCAIFGLAGVVVLWILLTEQIYMYWYAQNRYTEGVANWSSLANMYISVMWAIYAMVLMVVGFWRKKAFLRYIALGLFALLLGKVFILDTSTVKSVYRIAAFLATGLTLVGVSYLYQFLKKKGFFETVITQKTLENEGEV